MRRLSTLLPLLLAACASGTEAVSIQATRYPNDLADAYADPPERFAEPYDRELIADSLRRELGVPDLAAQQKRLEETKAKFAPGGRP